jgi:FtsZ-binding cell division protein ZapB
MSVDELYREIADEALAEGPDAVADLAGKEAKFAASAAEITAAKERDALRAEIERLKEELAEWQSVNVAQVELRGLVESHMDMARGQWECVAENERLTLADKQWADHVSRLADDVERLRVQVEETARECGIQKTDNERLRAALAIVAPGCRDCGRPLLADDVLAVEQPGEDGRWLHETCGPDPLSQS